MPPPAGDNLLMYLIVPDRASPTTSSATTEDSSSPLPKSISASLQEEYWRTRGQLDSTSYTKSSGSKVQAKKRQKMEVDTPTAVPSLQEPSLSNAGQIISIEEFMASRSMSQASIPAASSEAQPAPQPHAIAARSSKYTIELHEKYQALGIPRPDFVFNGGSSKGWSVRTEFLGRELFVEGPCGSKQEAKEKLSELALGVALEMEKEGKLVKAPRAKKQKEPVVNYVGQLLEFQRSTASPQPTYTDYQLGQSYSCEISIDGHPTPFGSRTTYFTSKKAARQHAASCAVALFQAAGLWPETSTDLGGIRKKKASVSAASPTANSTSTPNSPPVPLGGGVGSSDSIDAAAGSSSFAQRVAHLATQLSLSTPEWRFTPSSSAAPGFHTVSCFFKNGGPHEGPVGEVRHVFGKKKAKEECARLVYQYLVGVKERRIQYAVDMTRGVRGGDAVSAVVGRGVGRAVGDEEDAESMAFARRASDASAESEGEGEDNVVMGGVGEGGGAQHYARGVCADPGNMAQTYGTGGYTFQHEDESEDEGFASAVERVD